MKIQWFSSFALMKILALAGLGMSGIAASNTAVAHGTIISPPSRVWQCREEGPENPQSGGCIAAVEEGGSTPLYDWMSVLQGNADSNHQAVVPDGQLCSGGNPGSFGGLDLARTDWVQTPVSAGSQAFEWFNSAPHPSLYYHYYITTEGYDPTQPLAWEDLEFLEDGGGDGGLANPVHNISLPERTGQHVVYAVWQRSDSPEAFYACVDVVFDGSGGGSSSSASSSSSSSSSEGGENTCVGIPNWDSSSVYTADDQVRYNQNRYTAKWWTQGENPSSSGQWDVWIDQGPCQP